MASSFLPTSGQTFQCSPSYRDRLNRRFSGGFGRSLSGVGDFGRLESSRRSASHQCVRTHGSVCFASSLPCSSVRLFGSFLTDNVSVMTFIDRQGGTHSIVLNDLASRLWAWCRAARIFPIASHIPGEENLIADFLSRG